MFRLLLIAIVLLPAVSAAAEVDAEWREPVNRIGALVAELSAGDMEAAWQKFRIMLPEPPMSPKSPFDPDPFAQFQKQMENFPREIDSLSLIAERRFSPNSRRLYFLAEGKFGPVELEVLAYRYRGEWFFNHLEYHVLAFADATWHKLHDDVLPINKLAEPLRIELPQPVSTEQATAP